MTEADVIKLAFAAIVALIAVLYGAIQFEIRKLRKQGHAHANRLTEHALALGMLLKKVGIDIEVRKGE